MVFGDRRLRVAATPLMEHLEKLHHFVGIADSGSMAKAASKLRMTQPTLSHTVKVLESVLGTTLLLRSSQGVQLTEAGVYLYQYGKKLIAETAAIEHELHLREDATIEEVTVGTKEPFAIYLWPQYLRELETEHPSLDIALRIKRSNSELMEGLTRQEFDLVMLADPPDSEDVVAFKLFQESYGIFGPFEKSQKPSRLPFYLFKESICANNQNLARVLKRHHLLPSNTREVDSFGVARAMVINGLGLAVLPLAMAREDLQMRRIVPVEIPGITPEIFGKVRVCLCFHVKNSRHRKLRAILRTLRQWHQADV